MPAHTADTPRTSIPTHARRGFTLLEVMIVLVIIGVLGSIVTFNLVGAAERAKISATQASLKTIAGAMGMYKSTYNDYPANIDLLIQHNMLTITTDAWDRGIYITAPALDFSYEVRSMGPDGLIDTPDDVVQYPPEEIAQ